MVVERVKDKMTREELEALIQPGAQPVKLKPDEMTSISEDQAMKGLRFTKVPPTDAQIRNNPDKFMASPGDNPGGRRRRKTHKKRSHKRKTHRRRR